jgi:hypothetical protein
MQKLDISAELVIEILIEQTKKLALEAATLEAAVIQLTKELESAEPTVRNHDQLDKEENSND